MNKRDAVIAAIELLGTRSDLSELQHLAEQKCGQSIAYQYVCNVRREYRHELGMEEDCRTYETQYRRNHQNDQSFSHCQRERGHTFFSKIWPKERDLLDLIGNGVHKFHSLDQLRNFLIERMRVKRRAA